MNWQPLLSVLPCPRKGR